MPTHFDGTPEQRRALDLFIKLSRGTNAYTDRLNAGLADSGLTPSGFGVLETLYHLGPSMPSTLADKHLKSRNNLVVVIDTLERAGFVERRRCGKDRRAQWIHLTDSGREKIESVLPRFVDAVVSASAVLTPEEQVQLANLAKKLGLGE